MFEFLSPNMLKTYEQCPEKFRLKYAAKISMPVNDDVFSTGKNIHALASYYLRGEFIDNLEKALSSAEKEIWNYLKNINHFSYKVINTEYELSVRIGEVFFGGRIDALVFKDDCYYILDYKTGGVPKNYKNDFQTMIYMLAVSTFFKTCNVKFIYIDLKNKTEYSVELNENMINKYKEKLNKYVQRINFGDFSPSLKNCKYCEYKVICNEKLFD